MSPGTGGPQTRQTLQGVEKGRGWEMSQPGVTRGVGGSLWLWGSWESAWGDWGGIGGIGGTALCWAWREQYICPPEAPHPKNPVQSSIRPLGLCRTPSPQGVLGSTPPSHNAFPAHGTAPDPSSNHDSPCPSPSPTFPVPLMCPSPPPPQCQEQSLPAPSGRGS